jgi:hypothetical protein
MKFLVRMLNHFRPIPKPMHVGRWSNDCDTKTNKKIDYSNEDHCGPCGKNSLKYEIPKKDKALEIEIYKD